MSFLRVLDVNTIATYLQHFNDPQTNGIFFLIGYILKTLVLFGMGALWAYFHKSEPSLLKIFQLGIVATAIVSGFVQSNNTKDLREKMPNEKRKAAMTIISTV